MHIKVGKVTTQCLLPVDKTPVDLSGNGAGERGIRLSDCLDELYLHSISLVRWEYSKLKVNFLLRGSQ